MALKTKFKKTIRLFFKIHKIDVSIFSMRKYEPFDNCELDMEIKIKDISTSKRKYYLNINGKEAHKSYLFKHVFLINLLQIKGPVIGDCFTQYEFRGKGYYPYVINAIAKEVLKKKSIIYIIVDKKNKSSIKGIEKAGYNFHAHIKAKRWLFFYLSKSITYKYLT